MQSSNGHTLVFTMYDLKNRLALGFTEELVGKGLLRKREYIQFYRANALMIVA